MHIVKELIDNISSTSRNRFLTEQKIANEQRLFFSDHRGLLEQPCQKQQIDLLSGDNDTFIQKRKLISSDKSKLLLLYPNVAESTAAYLADDTNNTSIVCLLEKFKMRCIKDATPWSFL